MDFENYTERARGFVQSAYALALRSNHQRLTPEHLLKILLEDKQGLAANLVRAAGGNPEQALAAVEAELAKSPDDRYETDAFSRGDAEGGTALGEEAS